MNVSELGLTSHQHRKVKRRREIFDESLSSNFHTCLQLPQNKISYSLIDFCAEGKRGNERERRVIGEEGRGDYRNPS